MGVTLARPTPLQPEHDVSAFSCGHATLDEWLQRRALANQRAGASRVYVVTESKSQKVVAYYALASGALALRDATGKLRRNMPDPIPMAILGRLAINQKFQGKGLGRALFRDAAIRIIRAADQIGIRGLMVHAISDEAAAFYQALGLQAAPEEPRLFMMTLEELSGAM
jgi:GNAT superfamily N-acetyltransferase